MTCTTVSIRRMCSTAYFGIQQPTNCSWWYLEV